MFSLFYEGGPLFMGLITILALTMLYFSGKEVASVFGSPGSYNSGNLYYIRFFGMLALVTGVLGQIIGLYEAMKHISQAEGVSQQMLAAGFRISSISTLYGFIVFLIAHIIWFILDFKGKKEVVRA